MSITQQLRKWVPVLVAFVTMAFGPTVVRAQWWGKVEGQFGALLDTTSGRQASKPPFQLTGYTGKQIGKIGNATYGVTGWVLWNNRWDEEVPMLFFSPTTGVQFDAGVGRERGESSPRFLGTVFVARQSRYGALNLFAGYENGASGTWHVLIPTWFPTKLGDPNTGTRFGFGVIDRTGLGHGPRLVLDFDRHSGMATAVTRDSKAHATKMILTYNAHR